MRVTGCRPGSHARTGAEIERPLPVDPGVRLQLTWVTCIALSVLFIALNPARAVDRTRITGAEPGAAARRWEALGDPVRTFFTGREPDRRPGALRWFRLNPRSRFGIGYGPSLDRVDGLGLLLSQEIRTRGWGPSFSFYEAYGTASKQWSGAVDARIFPGDGAVALGFRWAEETRDLPLPRPAITGVENLFAAFFSREDTRDYYRREARSYYLRWAFPLLDSERDGRRRTNTGNRSGLSWRSGLILAYHDETHGSVERNVEKFGPFGGQRRFRENPAIDEGAWDLLQLRFSWSPYRPPSVWTQRVIPSLLLEGTWAGGSLGEGRAFTRWWAEYRGHQEMGGAQGVSFRLAGGATTQGSVGPEGSRLPFQWQFQAGGVGTLRGHHLQEFRGDRLVLATVEYGIEVGARARPVVFLDGGKAWNETDDRSGGVGGSGPLALDGGVGVLLGADGFRIDLARDLRRERAPVRVTMRLFHTL